MYKCFPGKHLRTQSCFNLPATGYYESMRKDTRIAAGRIAISRLLTAFFQMAEDCGDYNTIPDDHFKWYKTAGITKKTFVNAVKTYDNFRFLVKKFLLSDQERFMLSRPKPDNVYSYMRGLMQFAETNASDNERKRTWQEECRKELKFAILKFPEEDWMDILEPIRKVIISELPVSMDEGMRQETYEKWVLRVREELKRWLLTGMKPDEKTFYAKRIEYQLKRISEEIMDMKAFAQPIGQERQNANEPKELPREIPGYSWLRKRVEEKAREEWKKAHQKEGDEEG